MALLLAKQSFSLRWLRSAIQPNKARVGGSDGCGEGTPRKQANSTSDPRAFSCPGERSPGSSIPTHNSLILPVWSTSRSPLLSSRLRPSYTISYKWLQLSSHLFQHEQNTLAVQLAKMYAHHLLKNDYNCRFAFLKTRRTPSLSSMLRPCTPPCNMVTTVSLPLKPLHLTLRPARRGLHTPSATNDYNCHPTCQHLNTSRTHSSFRRLMALYTISYKYNCQPACPNNAELTCRPEGWTTVSVFPFRVLYLFVHVSLC